MSAPDSATRSLSSPSPLSLARRVGALVVLIVGADLWLTHHFGFGLENPGALAGIAAAVSTSLGFAAKLVPRADSRRIRDRLARWGRGLLSEYVLIVLYLVAGSVAATVSTVTIVRDTFDAAGTVEYTYLDTPRHPHTASLASDSLIRFTLLTTPFGRPIRITATGYVPTTFTVYPPAGLTVRLGRDVPVSPSVLFRPGVLGLRALGDGGSLRVWMVSPADTALVGEVSGARAAVLLGVPQPVPASVMEEWKLELTGTPDVVRDQMLLAWKRPATFPHRLSLGPGTRLIAEVRSRAKVPVARTEVVLGADRLLDVPLPDLPVSGGTP